MKNLLTFFIPILVLFACEGPQGISGIDGQDGQDGQHGLDGEEAYVFEYDVDFTSPDYSALLELPSSFTMLDSDVILVYLLWEVLSDGTEVWRAAPQSLFFSDGILHYNYDFTKFDATIFLDGTVNLNELDATYTDDWIVRIVVVPGQFNNGRSTVDLSDYEAVIDYYNLSEPDLSTDNYRARPE